MRLTTLVMKSLLEKWVPKNFGYLLLLTAFFILIEVSFFLLTHHDNLVAASVMAERMTLPAAVMPSMIFFVFSQLLIHFAYALIAGWIAVFVISAWRIQNNLIASVSVWAAGIVTLLMANAYYFPHSHFAGLFNVWLSSIVIRYLFMAMVIAWLIILFTVTVKLAKPIIWLVGISAIVLGSQWHTPHRDYRSAATINHPNVILVGVDSLRPDVLSFFGGEASTPFISQFLPQATVFNEALTPLARTYPSWVSILSGLYPAQTGVRTNLGGMGQLNVSNTLPSLLRQQGYETIYATDETRFSNIDKAFGFDRVVTPPMGINDFLLGSLNDFPLSNLLVNMRIGKWLFPYSYANRAAYATYQPSSFLTRMQPVIFRDHHKPVFLAVHFCLPHYPYLFAGQSGSQVTGQQRYLQSVVRVDQQLRDFFNMLRQGNLLNHAIVVLLSDHGEALALNGDRITEPGAYLPRSQKAPAFYPPSNDNLSMDQSAGHGTDVLGLPQYHSLLAFRLYGLGKQQARVVPGVVSLLDIKPTILDFTKQEEALSPVRPFSGAQDRPKETRSLRRLEGRLDEPLEKQPGGLSLYHYILASHQPPSNRLLFLESDFSPEAVRTIYPNVSKVMLEGADLFDVQPGTARLIIKKRAADMIVKSKQYAVIYDGWMLALYPQQNHTRLPILINLRSGNWTSDLHSAFAKASPINVMQHALNHYLLISCV